MALEINWRPEVGKKVEEFFEDPGYKEYLESVVSFNRKLNEERQNRLPYIDSQTGVAQRHYNSERNKRERMPGMRQGQVYSYPQKQWRKRKYQYLKYFLQPKRFDPEAEMHTISQVENPSALNTSSNIPPNEDSNTSDRSGKEWPYYDEDGFMDDDDEDPVARNSDSDFEYEDSNSRKRKSGRGNSGRGNSRSGRGGPGSGASKVNFGNFPGTKRRTHADNIPDSEKPFSCELCGARYKTRPGLSYHYNHTHKEPGSGSGSNSSTIPPLEEQEQEQQTSSSLGGGSITPPSTPGGILQELTPEMIPGALASSGTPGRSSGRRPGMYQDHPPMGYGGPPPPGGVPMPMTGPSQSATSGGPPGQDKKKEVKPSEYCDFCLGDSNENKKTGKPELLVSCAECGRSGHPTCLQFTDNMIISVRKYPWQCIECKTCTLCGTSENDDQLLFCDDCDRGYHMYCLVPPIKEPPEGSWSCGLCIENFHRK